ncbi:MAG: helix-turn-helix domain-containing protein [Asticcacaulis sp.]
MFDAAPLSHTVHVRLQPVLPQASPLDARMGGPVTVLAPGSEIYAEGDRSGALYQVAYGLVRVYRLLADGRRQICAFHGQGEFFGFETGAERHFFADAVTVTGLRALRPGSEAELSHDLFRLALKSLNRAHDHLLVVGRNDAVGRMAAFLMEMADLQDAEGSVEIRLPMPRADIADYLGLTIETVSRVLTRLKEARIIRLSSARQVNVLDWDALKAMTA